MTKQEILYPETVAVPKLPANLKDNDLHLFEKALNTPLPETAVYHYKNVTVRPNSVAFMGQQIIAKSLPSPSLVYKRVGWKAKLEHWIDSFRPYDTLEQQCFLVTDLWSKTYFHWMLDALPRLLLIKEIVNTGTLLLPGFLSDRQSYVAPTLKSFQIENIQYIREPLLCRNLTMPTHPAPTGNYRAPVIRELRAHFANAYQNEPINKSHTKVYISRAKTEKRKLINEDECIAILKEYGFNVYHFEDYCFEQQVAIMMNAQYLISNHGASLTNMLFMASGGSVLELRRIGDDHTNCYLSLASALNLTYFYQLCDSRNPAENTDTANLLVDGQQLRQTLEQMLAN